MLIFAYVLEADPWEAVLGGNDWIYWGITKPPVHST